MKAMPANANVKIHASDVDQFIRTKRQLVDMMASSTTNASDAAVVYNWWMCPTCGQVLLHDSTNEAAPNCGCNGSAPAPLRINGGSLMAGARCDECDGTGLRGGFHVRCSKGCELKV